MPELVNVVSKDQSTWIPERFYPYEGGSDIVGDSVGAAIFSNSRLVAKTLGSGSIFTNKINTLDAVDRAVSSCCVASDLIVLRE